MALVPVSINPILSSHSRGGHLHGPVFLGSITVLQTCRTMWASSLLNVFYNALQHVHVQFLNKTAGFHKYLPQYNSYYGGQVGVDINTYQVLIRVFDGYGHKYRYHSYF